MISTPPVARVLETSLYVTELVRAKAFYVIVFGFKVLMEDERMCALAVPGRQVLLLFRRGGSTQPSPVPAGLIPPHDASGAQHLCFAVSHDDVPAWQAHLAACGVAVESRLDWPQHATSLYFRDPDGNSLEVGTTGLWANDPNPQ